MAANDSEPCSLSGWTCDWILARSTELGRSAVTVSPSSVLNSPGAPKSSSAWRQSRPRFAPESSRGGTWAYHLRGRGIEYVLDGSDHDYSVTDFNDVPMVAGRPTARPCRPSWRRSAAL